MNDDELLARLKSVDPALAPHAPLPDIDRLVEDILTTDTVPQTGNTAPAENTAKNAARRSRRQLFGLAAAAGLLLLGGGIAAGVMANNDNGHSTSAGPLTLKAHGGSGSERCFPFSPDSVREVPTLFVGTATSVESTTVTFRVDHWLKGGGDAETVVLDSDANQWENLTFVEGERYIVAAADGVVSACGADVADDKTVDEFRQAFGK